MDDLADDSDLMLVLIWVTWTAGTIAAWEGLKYAWRRWG